MDDEKRKANRAIYDAVYHTPKDWLKPYGPNPDLTAVDASRTLELATEMWGPYGDCWGVRDLQVSIEDGHVIVTGILYYPAPDGVVGEIPIASNWALKHDAVKSCVTDSITKGLSMLGFHADVFKGENSHKEKAQQKKKAAKSPKQIAAEERQERLLRVDRFGDAIRAAQTDGPTQATIRANLNEARKAEEIHIDAFYYLMLLSLAVEGSADFPAKLEEYRTRLTDAQQRTLVTAYDSHEVLK